MARLDNGLIDFSLSVSQAEIALHDYVCSPQRGLEKLCIALLGLQRVASLSAFQHAYHDRLSSFLAIVDGLLASGSPYSGRYHTAFLSATDALFQFALGSQFGSDRSQQLDHLLCAERPCWAVIGAFYDEKVLSPTYVNYKARLSVPPASSDPISVDMYLEALSSSGRVSFQLDTLKGAVLEGQFLLTSVQPLSWLQARFPKLQWQIVSNHEEASLKELCKLSFLPLFQNVSMLRDSRYRLLGLFDDCFKSLFYQRFGALFPSDLSVVDQQDRLVPMSHNVIPFEPDVGVAYFPVRHGGAVYVGSQILQAEGQTLSYLECLGGDFLPYFLYEVDTSYGRFVFDKAECFGTYAVSGKDFFLLDNDLWFSVEGIRAQTLLSMPLFSLRGEAYCPLLESVEQVLLVKQEGRYFALPYYTINEIEGVCSRMQAPRSWVKNVWLNQQSTPLLEPWLLNVDKLPQMHDQQEENKLISPAKNGYYFGKVCGRMFWIEAELVLALLPYQSPFTVACFHDNNLSVISFIIYNGRCFDKVVLDVSHNELLGTLSEKYEFSVILERSGESIVLPFAVCDWCTSLPVGEYVREFSLPSQLMCHDDETSYFASLQDGVVVDKKNYLSFVAGFWPSSSFA